MCAVLCSLVGHGHGKGNSAPMVFPVNAFELSKREAGAFPVSQMVWYRGSRTLNSESVNSELAYIPPIASAGWRPEINRQDSLLLLKGRCVWMVNRDSRAF